jgi:hypothetical protein
VKIEKEDFELWRCNPVTEAVTRALLGKADEAKQRWIDLSWEGGNPDPLNLAALRASYEMAKDLSELTFDELERALNDEE